MGYTGRAPSAAPLNLSDIGDGIITADELSVGQLGGMRNRIINGDMRIWQRGTSSASSSAGYVCDRMATNYMSAVSRNTGPSDEFEYSLRLETGSYILKAIYQRIEAENSKSLRGKTVTFSAWVKSDLTTFDLKFYAPTVADDFSSVTTILNVTLSLPSANTWHKISYTYTLPTSVGNGLEVRLQQPAYNFQYIETTGWQLEEGSVATPFEHRLYGQELALCQRYCYVLPTAVQYPGATCFTTNRVLGAFSCATTFRATPTVTAASNSVYFFTNAAASLSSSTAITASIQGTVSVDITATATQGASGVISTNSQIVISAEL